MTAPTAGAPLTQAQSLIWAGQRLHPDVPLYNMVLAFRLSGNVDVAAFSAAFDALVTSTDAFRTVVTDDEGIPRRRVLDGAPAALEVVDLSGAVDPAAAVRTLVDEAATAPFDLSRALYRSGLAKLAESEFVWWLSQHHLTTDGWSVAIVYRRMADLYAAAVAGELDRAPADYPQFERYAEFEQRSRDSAAFAEAATFWAEKAARQVEPPSFYGVAPPPGGSTRTDRVTSTLGAERAARLDELVSGDGGGSLMAGMSQFSVFATVLCAVLARITSRRDLAVLAPAHNRPSARFKATAGLFIEVLPLHVTIGAGETFRTLLEKVSAEAQDLMLHARPGTSSATHNRADSVLLNFINASFGDFAGMPMRSEWVHAGHGDADHMLRLQVHDFDATGDWTLHFDVNRDVFDGEREQALIRHFMQMFDAMLADLDTPIASVDLLTAQERTALDAVNDTAAEVPFATVVAAFDRQVARTPDAVAVRLGEATVSYAELDGRSDRLAAAIDAVVTGAPTPRVAIYLPRSIEMVTAVVGVLKAGAAYVPIDRQYPPERIGFLLADSEAAAVVTTAELASLLPDHDARVITVPLGPGGDLPRRRDPGPDDVAYVMYTSGSTGEPKGVLVSHGSLANYVAWAAGEHGRGGPVSYPLYSSFGFDLTVTSLYVPLVTGGEVVVYPEPEGTDLSVLDVFGDDLVDVVKLTPSHLALLDPALLDTKRIRTLMVGGEDLKTAVARAAFDASFGRLEIVNEYGPTEATVGCMIHRYDPTTDTAMSVPLGRPAANTRITIRDDDLALVPLGVIGEICVGGAGVALGYLGRPELTAERFVADPDHPGEILYRTGDLARWRSPGAMEFLGRADTQVKVRGFRIELGEIETALAAQPDIAESFVAVVESETERAASASIRYCVRCGLASNHPDAQLDDAGVCRPCLFYDAYRHRAEDYFGTMDEFRALLADATPNAAGQDCVMLLSGGKDSTYALYQLVANGLTPLVFSLENGFISEGAKTNIRRVVDDLGLELVMDGPAAMNDIFADSLRRFSNVCQGCFKTVYTLGMNLAHQRGLRHVITGLSRGQIFETRLADLFRIGIVDRDEVDAAIVEARRAYHREDDAVRRSLDTTLFDDDTLFDQIQIVDFYRYHDVGLAELYGFLDRHAPWVRPADTGRSTNCLINNTGIFVHKTERGYHNYALPYSWDVRLGHKTRDAALAELDDEIDVTQVRGILAEVGYEIETPVGGPAALGGLQKRLVAYYVASGEDVTDSQVRSHLDGRLPDYMVPSYFVRLDAMPLTINGKVDRKALPDPRLRTRVAAGDYAAPRNPVEERLVDIWQSVLGVEGIGTTHRFIELGGDSILTIQVVAKAKAAGLRFTPQQLFRLETISELAKVVEEETAPVAVPVPAPAPGGFGLDIVPEAGLSPEELDDVLRTFGGAE